MGKFTLCAGYDFCRVNFLLNRSYGAVFCVSAENSADNTGIFSLLLSSPYTESQPFLLLITPDQQGVWGCTRT